MWTLFPRYIPWKVDFRHVEWLLSMPFVVSFLLESWKTLHLYGFSCARRCYSVAHSNGSAPSWKWCTASLVLNPIWRKRDKGVCHRKQTYHSLICFIFFNYVLNEVNGEIEKAQPATQIFLYIWGIFCSLTIRPSIQSLYHDTFWNG